MSGVPGGCANGRSRTPIPTAPQIFHFRTRTFVLSYFRTHALLVRHAPRAPTLCHPIATPPPGSRSTGRITTTSTAFPFAATTSSLERLALEINQAGLSWLTILKKTENFHRAFDGFDVDRVAGYGEAERARLLGDAGIIRNRLKVDAVIENARRIQQLRAEYGSFAGWLDAHHPLTKPEWIKLFKKTFRFTGGEIVGEFLMSLGYLPGAHKPECPVYARVLAADPPWARTKAVVAGG